MKIIFTVLLLLSQQVFATIADVTTSSPIEASKINEMISSINKTYDVGDVRSSLLPEALFQSRNGNCWVLMNGQSVEGSLYAAVTGRSNLPSAAGRFLRNAGGNAAALAQTQEDEFKSHNHGTINGINSNNNSGSAFPAMSNLNNRANVNTTDAGGIETRPKNLTVNMFVKINNCD